MFLGMYKHIIPGHASRMHQAMTTFRHDQDVIRTASALPELRGKSPNLLPTMVGMRVQNVDYGLSID